VFNWSTARSTALTPSRVSTSPPTHETSSHLRFLIGPLIIAAGTSRTGDALATIFQDERDTRWLELRSHGRELCILSDVHPAAERGNDGIVDHRLSKGA